jgi:hypothetical protein
MRANNGTVGSRTSKTHYMPADISALLPQVGLLTVHVRQHQREVCRLSPWDDVALRLNPYPAHYRPAFACSLLLYPQSHRRFLRAAFLSDKGLSVWETTGLPRSATVTVWVRSRLFAGGSTTAPEEFGASGPGRVPFWSKPVSIFGLSFVTTIPALHLC